MADQLDFENAKLYLMSEQNGASLYQHLADLLIKIYSDRKDDYLSQLEFHSHIEKQGQFRVPNEAYDNKLDQEQPNISRREAINKWISNLQPRFKKVDEIYTNQIKPRPSTELVVDTVLDMKALQWVGVGLSQQNAYALYLSLQNLAINTSAKHVRFWGKIFGKTADYYIAETILNYDEEEEHDKNAEKGGANKYTFFVCHDIGSNWLKLPDVLPEQIVSSRKIRRYFTGDLDSPVLGHPPFKWREREFLRAQIARISCGTIISPDGVYRIADGEDPFLIEKIPEEEATKPEIESLNGLNSWVHLHYDINVLGRVKAVKIKNEDNEEVDDPDTPELVPPLTNLEPEEEHWSLRTFPHVGSNVTPSIISLKCERWSGSYALFTGGRTTNIYFGYGIKTNKINYSPEPPVPVMKEYSNPEYKEQKDLNKDPNPPEEQEEAEQEGDQEADQEVEEPEPEEEEPAEEN